ncbi:hypothetical protein P8452_61780 [Trifolium repens]|nr:hypothetical protein P8452_61780 [Trifolium repens]
MLEFSCEFSVLRSFQLTMWFEAVTCYFDSARTHGILLEAVQILSDLNLFIKKAYVSSNGRRFMDVFHVTDQNGNKLTDESVLKYIEQRTDRVGLLSEMFAVLAELQCDVVEAKVWIHIGRIASLIYVKDCNIGTSIEDYQKINRLEARLRYVLQGDSDVRSATTSLSDVINPERRLHQIMFSDRDYQKNPNFEFTSETPLVTVQNWAERGYSVVNVQYFSARIELSYCLMLCAI